MVVRKSKELSLFHELKLFNHISLQHYGSKWKPLLFQTFIVHSLKYLRSTTSSCKVKDNRKSEMVINTQFFNNQINTKNYKKGKEEKNEKK